MHSHWKKKKPTYRKETTEILLQDFVPKAIPDSPDTPLYYTNSTPNPLQHISPLSLRFSLWTLQTVS